ncbi:MAG: DsrE family protein [Pseudomonadota bacterium]
MKQLLLFVMIAGLIAVLLYQLPEPVPEPVDTAILPVEEQDAPETAPDNPLPESSAVRGVLGISVHTVEEMELLLGRAEELARRPRPAGREDNIVLVLHGPEVEFFTIPNYEKYKDIVDRAAKLDAFEVVDVKICQTMMGSYGITPDDIPAFIEQVPYGPAEVERLVREGYVYF